MDLLNDHEHVWDDWNDWDDEEHIYLGRERRQYTMLPRIQLEKYDDVDFIRRFRLSKNSVIEVVELIREKLLFPGEQRSRYITPVAQVLITLRFCASGSFLITVGDFAGVCTASVSNIVKRVSLAIAEHKQQYIKMPQTREEMLNECRKFYAKCQFPRAIGAIDCTHIKIQSPGGLHGENFRNRKGWFSLNCQTVSSADLRVCNLECRWPGATHDQTIFRNSNICHLFEGGYYGNFLLVGDSGYKNTKYMATPYTEPQTPAEKLYNESQIRTRVVVERSYGVLKRRFPCLAMGLRVRVDTVRDIITACCILHNIAIDHGDICPPVFIEGFADMLAETQIPAEPIAASRRGRADANTVRAYLTTTYFQRKCIENVLN